jgi:hypothetical protein
MATLSFPLVPQAVRPRLDDQLPPTKPPATLGFGAGCFRAVAHVEAPGLPGFAEVPGWTPVVRVTGYDASPRVAATVDAACKAEARKVPGSRCTESTLVMLKKGTHVCGGEVFVAPM